MATVLSSHNRRVRSSGFGLVYIFADCVQQGSAGHLTEAFHSGTSVATVAGWAYCGSIISSPLVGLAADLSGSLWYGLNDSNKRRSPKSPV
jgi:hypothetical protein